MHSATIDRPTKLTVERGNLSEIAKNYLETHPHFRGRVNEVAIQHKDKTLYLSGRLPTFYLKQLVQEAVRHVPGVQYVRNMIDVVNVEGVSSVRC
jgi:osmotically-inducible protein OsmY